MVFNDAVLDAAVTEQGLAVSVTAEQSPVSYIRLRWNRELPEDALFCGDAWERSYGDLRFAGMDASRMMPWYFLMRSGASFAGCGVMVRCGAMAQWSADPCGITLWLDVRSGTEGVRLNGRTLLAATVVSGSWETDSALEAGRNLCRLMCKDPLLPEEPVYGGNNWYYAYGSITHESVLADCREIAELSRGLTVRPFMVIDDGWEVRHCQPENSGPWDRGNERFPDMKRLAEEMRRTGVRPGIWFRPLWNEDAAIPEEWLLARKGDNPTRYLDPSRPEVVELVKQDVRRIVDWGYELIKHDFTTFDIFGSWGRAFSPWPAQEPDWSFHDNSRTSAEIIVDLYRAIREAAGGALILGCNTIGHLGAGLMHLSRTGDDTSGLRWDRTRKMGVNTLAFRLCQHKTFFDVDADCIGISSTVPGWLNMQWAELLAKSSTAFFASITPGVMNGEERDAMRKCFELASRQNVAAEPLDMLHNATPEKWSFDGEIRKFHWYEEGGATMDFLPPA
ncbi:MAG: alpha-galactosidase [Victivallales bacterium]|nr:alpha-galactosidase [Victivallales bacterium]